MNLGTLTFKINALPLSYLGRQPVSILSLRKPLGIYLHDKPHLVYHTNSSTEEATGNKNTTKQWKKYNIFINFTQSVCKGKCYIMLIPPPLLSPSFEVRKISGLGIKPRNILLLNMDYAVLTELEINPFQYSCWKDGDK